MAASGAQSGRSENVSPANETWMHRRVVLPAVGNQTVAGQRVVTFPASELSERPGAVDTPQPRAVALPPDHAFSDQNRLACHHHSPLNTWIMGAEARL